ncbi:MAG: ABC transporter ATP-binding protein [Burkholderiaceae bacterium]|nr:ABC transporter ATP-binding protein [Burkholderiaceae bacterium]
MTTNLAVDMDNVSCAFGGLRVLEGVNLKIPEGSVFGLIGPNGAGKTTAFNLVSGVYQPTGGSIKLFGQDIQGRATHEITRLGIGRTFQNIRLFREMTILENVMVGMHGALKYNPAEILLRMPRFRTAEREARDRARELLGWVGLDGLADELAENLSYGNQRKLELARALATSPRILMLDEPVAGMNSGEKMDLMREIEAIAKRGYTIFLIEHDVRFVMSLCSEIAVLNFGRIIAQGQPEQIRNDPQVIEAYLGREDDDEEAQGAVNAEARNG